MANLITQSKLRISLEIQNSEQMTGNTKLKICGLSTEETIEVSSESGAFMIGFVFFERSPRHVSLSRAAELAKFSRRLDQATNIVALTVNSSDSELQNIVDLIEPDFLQLHGNESPERTHEIREFFGLQVIKAIGISSASDLDLAYKYENSADWLLFDAKPKVDSDLPGGTGKTFDWNILSNIAIKKPFLVSGGLNKENVGEAVEITKPDAVDVSSGVESQRGTKDSKLIRQFADAVKNIRNSK